MCANFGFAFPAQTANHAKPENSQRGKPSHCLMEILLGELFGVASLQFLQNKGAKIFPCAVSLFIFFENVFFTQKFASRIFGGENLKTRNA